MEALRRISPVPIEMKPLSNDLDGFSRPPSRALRCAMG